MLYEITGICSSCEKDYKIILSDNKPHGTCSACGESPMKFKKFKGQIYVVRNPLLPGVKVGLTTKDIHIRARQLSSTGVPGAFAPIAVFPSDFPEKDVRRQLLCPVHDN